MSGGSRAGGSAECTTGPAGSRPDGRAVGPV